MEEQIVTPGEAATQPIEKVPENNVEGDVAMEGEQEFAQGHFRAKLEEGHTQTFKKIVDCVKELCDECTFECSQTGLECQCMDTSHVSLVHLHLKNSGFEEFECGDEISLGLNLTNLTKILKCSGSRDCLEISASDAENVTLTFESVKESRCSRFDMKLFDIDEEQLGIPETEYGCKIEMASSEFARICRDMTALGGSMELSATKQGIEFSVKGDIGNGSVVLQQGETVDANVKQGIRIELDEPVNQQFALRYLCMFAKSAAVSDRVSLCMNPETPIKVEFVMEGLGFIRFFLAPKIEED